MQTMKDSSKVDDVHTYRADRLDNVLHKVAACNYVLCLPYNIENHGLAVVVPVRPLKKSCQKS